MRKLLIVYGTTEGQTAKVVRHIEKKVNALNWEVTGYNAIEHPPSPHGYDLVLLAGFIHMGKFQEPLEHYANEYSTSLTDRPNALVAVCMAAAHLNEESRKEVDSWLSDFKHKTGWNPEHVELVAGALKYVQYNWMKKMVIREIARSTGQSTDTSQDHEYTDWNKLDTFVEQLLAKVSDSEVI